MIKFEGNFYLVKGRIIEPCFTTFEGVESDSTLENNLKKIIPAMESLVNKNKDIKLDKKSVWFIEIENAKWLESGSFKDWDKSIITINKTNYTPSEFKKLDKKYRKEDARLQIPDFDVVEEDILQGE